MRKLQCHTISRTHGRSKGTKIWGTRKKVGGTHNARQKNNREKAFANEERVEPGPQGSPKNATEDKGPPSETSTKRKRKGQWWLHGVGENGVVRGKKVHVWNTGKGSIVWQNEKGIWDHETMANVDTVTRTEKGSLSIKNDGGKKP